MGCMVQGLMNVPSLLGFLDLGHLDLEHLWQLLGRASAGAQGSGFRV